MQEQVAPDMRCLSSVLLEGLTSKAGIDTIWFLPCGYMASMQTQISSQAEAVV